MKGCINIYDFSSYIYNKIKLNDIKNAKLNFKKKGNYMNRKRE